MKAKITHNFYKGSLPKLMIIFRLEIDRKEIIKEYQKYDDLVFDIVDGKLKKISTIPTLTYESTNIDKVDVHFYNVYNDILNDYIQTILK
jgi:hypothetical protein